MGKNHGNMRLLNRYDYYLIWGISPVFSAVVVHTNYA